MTTEKIVSFILFFFMFCVFFLHYVKLFCICRFRIKSIPKVPYNPCRKGKEGFDTLVITLAISPLTISVLRWYTMVL